MRYATVRIGDVIGPAAVRDERVVPLRGPDWPADLAGLIAAGPMAWREVAAWCETREARADELPLDEVALEPPLRPTGFIFTIGENYAPPGGDPDKRGDAPKVFGKLPGSVVGPGASLGWDPELLSLVDYEVELAVVIGQPARGVPVGSAAEHVFGYTCLNDIASREDRYDGDQFLLGKSHPSFCPLGPWIVTPDEFGDPHALRLRSVLNGDEVQSGNTAQMRFRIPEIVAYLSRFTELRPGDVIATGTPPGTGIDRRPPRLLTDGDEIAVEIEGIGSLRNRVDLGA